MHGSLFYTPRDKKLFLIPKYYVNGSSDLDVFINQLIQCKEFMSKFVEGSNNIYCFEIKNSTRYKNNWVFFTTVEYMPDEAYVLGHAWTMHEWITF